MKTKQAKHALPSESMAKAEINLKNAFLLTGMNLHSLAMDYQSSHPPVEKKFRSVKELEEIVFQNSKTLFGQQTVLLPMPAECESVFGKDIPPAGFLFDASEVSKSKLYVVDTLLSQQDFYGFIFPRITNFFRVLKNQEAIDQLCDLISKDKAARKVLSEKMKLADIPQFLKTVTFGKSFILLISDSEKSELSEMEEVYPDTWNRVKPLLLNKYASNGNTLITMQPSFGELTRKSKSIKAERPPSTEENHLKDVSDTVREVYGKIKAELLKVNDQLQFNPQTYYISLKKDTNLAFFHIGKKRISLVVKHPEKDTRKLIKHHEVKTLTEKVQKFWNGPSCTVVIESASHLNEVITLLKKIIVS